MEVSPQKVLSYFVRKYNGTETNPLRLGNVEFWFPVEGIHAGLCYSLPTNQWDREAVQADINKLAEANWDDLVSELSKPEETLTL